MESIDLNLIISNAQEDTRGNIGLINSSDVHRVVSTSVYWIPKNRFFLINETMRQRLNLGPSKTLPPDNFIPEIKNLVSSRGPYRTYEYVYLSLDPINYRLKSIAWPILIPDLPVEFVLGTLFFDELNLIWSPTRNLLVTREQAEQDKQEIARRQAYRNIL